MLTDIVFDQEQHLGLVTLNRPHALNALTLPMIKALQQQLQAWAHDASIHAVVMRAAPCKAFCAGGDVRWLYDMGKQHDAQQMQFFWHEYRLNHYIHTYPKPYIALMDGITMGGGVGIAMHGSHPVATERFVFAMPETSIGFFPDIGASHLLTRCPDQVGIYLGLTGATLNALDAKALGLIKHSIMSEQVSQVLAALVIADLTNQAHVRVTECLSQFNLPQASAPISLLQPAIKTCFQAKSVEAIIEALKQMVEPSCQSIYTSLMQKAPLSLKVTLAQLERAQGQTLAECLIMDYNLVQHFMQDQDFYEGVRALLVDKDKQPHWQPNSFTQVTEMLVEQYFTAHGQPLMLLESA